MWAQSTCSSRRIVWTEPLLGHSSAYLVHGLPQLIGSLGLSGTPLQTLQSRDGATQPCVVMDLKVEIHRRAVVLPGCRGVPSVDCNIPLKAAGMTDGHLGSTVGVGLEGPAREGLGLLWPTLAEGEIGQPPKPKPSKPMAASSSAQRRRRSGSLPP